MATQTITASAPEADHTSQVRIRLSSRSPDIALPEDTGPILVSTELRRYQLSTLVNRLLTTEKPIPFEFLINGQFLRTSLDDFLTANGISAETTLSVEYVRALIPPAHVASFEHDDWVSSVDVLSSTSAAGKDHEFGAASDRIISGSYDGLLRTWNASGDLIATSQSAAEGGHTGPVKALKFLSPTQVASSSLDRTIRLWNYADSDTSSSATFTPMLELYGHSASIDSLAVHAPSSRILSASADHSVGIWSTSKSRATAAPPHLLPLATSNKRRKLSSHSAPAPTAPQRGPLALLTSHTAPVSGVTFAPSDPSVAYSTSWDHSLKTWDLATQSVVDTRTTSHSLLSVAAMDQVQLVAAGTSARHISLIDPRASATRVVAMTLRGHLNAVVALAQSPSNGYVLASGSHDGSVRVWDVRSVRASNTSSEGGGQVGESIFVLEREGAKKERTVGGEGVKVFGLAWDEKWGIVSSGEDKRVQVNREEVR